MDEVLEDKYFVALVPRDPLEQKLYALKELAFERFGTRSALRSPAHITLHMPFVWTKKRLPELFTVLSRCASSQMPFDVELVGCGGFPPRVVFVTPVPCEPLMQLHATVKEYFKKDLFLFNADHSVKPFHPHITVAFRDLKKQHYEEALRFFSSLGIRETMPCKALSLLRHDGKKWEVFREWPLGIKNTPDTAE